MTRTRFAPSPTGPLHLGHACAALIAFERAERQGGEFLLRIEDIDPQRSKPEWEAAIHEDLAWLGLSYPRPVLRQSDRLAHYAQALESLSALGLVYPCRCRRADIRQALSAPQEGAPILGPDGLVYPGLCRHRSVAEAEDTDVWRLDIAKALALAGPISFTETGPIYQGLHSPTAEEMIHGIGDVVLSRRDFGTSYHLSVVVDDAAQAITEVTRGADLFEATPLHVLLQKLLGLPQPQFHHHALVRDPQGRRLAKRDDARALSRYRAEGISADEIRAMVAQECAQSRA